METKYNIGDTIVYFSKDFKVKSEFTISEIKITGTTTEDIWYFDKYNAECCTEDEIIDSSNGINTNFVDLGLPSGLKWAKCNVGAKTPTECGNYFCWGEVFDAREMGSVENYDHNKPFEDAATYHMGKQWRMPTKEEFQELYVNTTSKWVKSYQGSGVSGRLFTSRVNGETLFFPADGGYNGDYLNGVGSYNRVWSLSISTSNSFYAYLFYFSGSGVLPQLSNYRYFGFSVRGVRN